MLGFRLNRKIDPKLAADIAADIAEMDGKSEETPADLRPTPKTVPCGNCQGGLTADGQHCPKCQATGKIVL